MSLCCTSQVILTTQILPISLNPIKVFSLSLIHTLCEYNTWSLLGVSFIAQPFKVKKKMGFDF